MADKVEVHCPACNRQFNVPPAKLGRSAKCPCGQTFKLEQPADDDDDMYALAEDDDIPALASPPPRPAAAAPGGPGGTATPARSAPRPQPAGGKIGGYEASAAVGIGLTGKRHVEHDEPPALGRGVLVAAVLTVVTVGVWYAIKTALPPGSPMPIGAMAIAVGSLAGLGMAIGAVRGNNATGFVAMLIALVGLVVAKTLIISVLILPNKEARNAQNVEQTFGAQVKVEDLKIDWRREDVAEQMAIESFGSEENFRYQGPQMQESRLKSMRRKSRDLSDEELEKLEARRDMREARNHLQDESYSQKQAEHPSSRERVIHIYERQAEDEIAAMSDDEVLDATAQWRADQRFDELVRLHVNAKLEDEGLDPDGFDNKTYDRREALTEEARTELAGMSQEEQDALYQKYRDAEYDDQIEAEVASRQRDNPVENIAAEAQTWSDMMSCGDLVFAPLGLAAAFGFGVTGKFWGKR